MAMQEIKVNISLVTSLSDEEVEQVASLSSLGYLNSKSPRSSLLTGGKLELLPDLIRAMTRCCLTDGECYIATDVATQKIVATALWFPPGKKLWATDEAREISGFNTFFGKLDPAGRDWWVNEYQTEIDAFLKENYGSETYVNSWWLNGVAVLPEYQRRGIASSILGKVLEKAAAHEAIGLFTDTENNTKFYKSLRFKEIGDFYVRNPEDGSDVKIWGFKQYGVKDVGL